jgi:hypothetical protein
MRIRRSPQRSGPPFYALQSLKITNDDNRDGRNIHGARFELVFGLQNDIGAIRDQRKLSWLDFIRKGKTRRLCGWREIGGPLAASALSEE